MQRTMMMVMSYAVCCATNLAPPTMAQIRYIVGCVNGPLFSHRLLPAFKSRHHTTAGTLAKAVYLTLNKLFSHLDWTRGFLDRKIRNGRCFGAKLAAIVEFRGTVANGVIFYDGRCHAGHFC